MLLAIAKAVTSSGDLADEEADIDGHTVDRELSGGGAVGVDGEGCCLFADDLLGIGVYQLEFCRTADVLVGGVKQTG